MKNFTLLLLLSILTIQFGFSQDERYIDDVFMDVNLQENVIYGINATILARLAGQADEAIPRPLNADVYTPAGDTETERPLIILLHTGNFLPPTRNGGCGGTVKDNDMVNFATRLAKKGYVVAVADYRIGWNPLDPSQSTRTFFLINAAYRGVQDSRTAVRYFKKTVAENSNPFGIDPNKIAIWGLGTGGYIAYGSSFLDVVEDTFLSKFSVNGVPMVIREINGNVDGTSVGITPANYPGLPEGDTLCYPNHVNYSSEFQLGIAAGGANGADSWIDADDTPFIGFHVKTDPFAPCETGVLTVPPPANLPIVSVSGACATIPLANAVGLNDVFDVNFIDDVSIAANNASGGVSGFYPFTSDDPTESAPWNFAVSEDPYNTNPDVPCQTEAVETQIVVDTMMAFATPRICLALNLGCNLEGTVSSTVNLDAAQVGLQVIPNPASIDVRFDAKENIQSIYVYDLTGRLVKAHTDINDVQFTMQRHNLANGLYIAQVRFENGFVNQKLSFN